MSTNPEMENLLDRLRRSSTMSPAQQSTMLSSQPQQQSATEHIFSQQQPYSQPYPQQQQQQYNSASSPIYGGLAPTPDNNGFAQQHPPPPENVPTPPYNLPMSPSSVGNGTENRTASLLQLLKFSQAVPATSSPAPEQIEQPSPRPAASPTPPRPAVNSPGPQAQSPAHNRAISASDLVASLFGRQDGPAGTAKENTPPARASPVLQRTQSDSVSLRENPKDLVFQLLGRPKPAQDDARSLHEMSSLAPAEEENAATPEGSGMPPPPQLRSSSAQQDTPPANKGMFTYVNPFEQLQATSPRNRTPKSATPGPAAGRKSALSMHEMRAENIPLPYTPSPVEQRTMSPPPIVEAQAAKEAATFDQIKEKERMLMEQLGQHITDAYPMSNRTEIPDTQPEVPRHAEPAEFPPEPSDATVVPERKEKADAPPSPVPEAPAANLAEGPIEEEEDAYESATEGPIEVYNFPMKPFSSITIVPSAIRRPKYPSAKIADIVRMSRSFDQLDRNLIAASHHFIAYSVSKSGNRGGIRVIRQFDGKDRVIMKDSPDRTFNVAIGKGERVLGTGVSGAVVWVDLMADFETTAWDSMFVFPPSEEQGQSNGVLKSRARKTSRQIDVFAIGRGKTISIIHAPAAKAYAQGRKNNEVASKMYLADHCRTIDTGKASKDFTFSDDDSVIISIDKAGKLKFWDVQELLNFSENDAYDLVKKTFTPQSPMTLSTPTLVFSAVAAGETYRATSVMFLDKYRPYHKCMALRYVIVGMKQNHTLQLWDLALGRPVQEINFPQESDTDALCSVAYHPMSGIIVVGNPTRNSIYFIHLSAPKYNLPTLSQAQYIKGLAEKDPTIPKPDATAILSGLREYSFASKGQLMSLDILDTEGDGNEESNALFELYIAHSKGMTSLSVYKDDLGWEVDNRVKNPVDGIVRGACTISNLPPPPPPEKEREEKAEASDAGLKPKSEKSNKSRSVSPATQAAEKTDAGEGSSSANGASKKKRKEKASIAPAAGTNEPSPATTADEVKAEKSVPATSSANGKAKATAAAAAPSSEESNIGVSASFLDREIKKFEKAVSAEFSKVMGKELEALYGKFNEDRRVQQAAADSKQEAILKLISTTLTEQVEQVLGNIVMTNIQTQVLPAIADVTVGSVDRMLADALIRTLSMTLPVEMQRVLPEAINRTLSSQELLTKISDALTRPIAQAVEQEFNHSLHTSLIPSFQKLAVDMAQKAVHEVERKQNETIARLEHMHKQDSKKIDQLMQTVMTLSETVSTMSRQQTEFQEQVRAAQEEFYAAPETPTAAPPQEPAHTNSRRPHHKTPEQLEAEEIEALLRAGRYEDGTIKWLQSKERQAELFDEVMVRYRYDFRPNLSQLVLLSVSAAVSVKFEHKIVERLNWLEGVLAVLDPMDPEIHEICTRIMNVVVQRLEQLYVSTDTQNSSSPILRKIPSIARRARDLSSMSAGR